MLPSAFRPLASISAIPPASAQFRARVAKAVAATCNPGDRIGADMSPDFACRKSMQKVSEVRIAQRSGKSDSRMANVD